MFDWGVFRENPRRGRYKKFSIGPKHFAPPKSGRIDAGEISRKSGPALEISAKIGKRIVESLFSSPMPIKTGFELFLDSALRQNFLISPRVGEIILKGLAVIKPDQVDLKMRGGCEQGFPAFNEEASAADC